MRAALLTKYGGKDSIVITKNVTKPALRSGEVLLEVHAVSINPYDVKIRDGVMKDSKTLKMPAILGGDVAGIVVRLGKDVVGIKVGQEVFGMANAGGGRGAFAEYAPVPAIQLAPKPQSADFATSAALPLTATSAYEAIIEHMNLQSGQKVLIHGGAGGIGSIAIQIAAHIGARVATTASGSNIEYVRSLGAEKVIDYTKEDFSTIVRDYDAVFDTIGGETNVKSYEVIKQGGVIVSMVTGPDERLVKFKDVTYVHQASKATTTRLKEISEMIDNGDLRVNVDDVFPFNELPSAMEYLKTAHTRGKVVVDVKSLT